VRRHAFMAAALCLVACTGGGDAAPPEIRIGLLATMEGRFSETSGQPSKRGAELAVAERNAGGGVTIGGVPYRVRLIVRSYASRADAAAQARALINQDSIHALVGPQLSVHAIPVAVMAEDARVVMISPMSSNPETTAGKRYVFRLAFLDDFQGEVLGNFARHDLDASRAAILYEETSSYSRGLAREFRKSFEASGGTVVAEEHFLADDPVDYRHQLRRIEGRRPEVLLLPNTMFADSVQLRQAREIGLDVQILGTDTWDLQQAKKMDAAEGLFVTHQWHHDLPGAEVARFLDRFDAAYGRRPKTTAAMTYDAVRLLLDAMENAGSVESDAVRTSLATGAEFEGVTGRISFDGGGSPRRSAVISKVIGGEAKFFRVVDP